MLNEEWKEAVGLQGGPFDAAVKFGEVSSPLVRILSERAGDFLFSETGFSGAGCLYLLTKR